MKASQPLRTLQSLWRDFTTKRVMNAASSLTYSTLLAIVPVVAVIFAIARGFGYNKYIEEWFRQILISQPQVSDVIIGFVNSYLVHTKSGIVFGFGLVFMLWTIIMLTRNIEQTFNDIWGIYRQRSPFRTLTDYLAIFFILPIVIILISGIMLWVATLNRIMSGYYVIGWLVEVCINILPVLALWGIILLLYVLMPNTHVRWQSALIPALGATICMQLLQLFYIHSQMWVSSYNAIYGSFAALPLFMMWLQFTWTIILIGAELTFTNQNLEDLRTNINIHHISQRHRIVLCAIIMSHICKRQRDGHKPMTMLEIKNEVALPSRVLSELLYALQRGNMLIEISNNNGQSSSYIPAESIENLTMGMLISRLESLHPWSLDVELRHFLDTPKWKRSMLMHHNYIRAQKDIKLYELL